MLRKWKEKYIHKKLMQRHLELLNFSNFWHEFRYDPFTETEFEQFLIHFDFIRKNYPIKKEYEDKRIEELININLELQQLSEPITYDEIIESNALRRKATQQEQYIKEQLQNPWKTDAFQTFLYYTHPSKLKLQYRQLCFILNTKNLEHTPFERTLIHYMIQHILKGIDNQTLLKEE